MDKGLSISLSDVVLSTLIGGIFSLVVQAISLSSQKRSQDRRVEGDYLSQLGSAYKGLLESSLARIKDLETRLEESEAHREKLLIEIEQLKSERNNTRLEE